MKCIAPSRMSPADRMAELGDLLAAGVQRLLARQCKRNRPGRISQDQLDVTGANEASCGPFRMEATT